MIEITSKNRTNNAIIPTHYSTKEGVETIDIIAWVVEDYVGVISADIANVVKYCTRSGKKLSDNATSKGYYEKGIQDINKAQWYISHAIKTGGVVVNRTLLDNELNNKMIKAFINGRDEYTDILTELITWLYCGYFNKADETLAKFIELLKINKPE